MQTVNLPDGTILSLDNPYAIPYCTFADARQKLAKDFSLRGGLDWLQYNAAAKRALKKALDWEENHK